MRELFSLAGQVALVTGASGGLGAHFAQVLATAGATVAVAARRDDRVAAVVSEIVSTGGRALAVSLDVTNPESVASAFDVTEQDAGLVTVVVNNAGIGLGGRFFLGLHHRLVSARLLHALDHLCAQIGIGLAHHRLRLVALDMGAGALRLNRIPYNRLRFFPGGLYSMLVRFTHIHSRSAVGNLVIG